MNPRIVLLSLLMLVPSVSYAADGVLFLSPGRATFATGDVFEIDVLADTGAQASNAAEADISFNPQALSVEKISTDGSVLSLWPSVPTFSNTDGTIRFSGTAGGGFTSDKALLVRIMFRAKGNLPGDVHFDSGAILANDARATNIIANMRSGLYTIVAQQSKPAEDVPVPVETTEASAPVPEVKGAAVQIPTITGYDDRVSIGERIVLQGTAAPDSKVTVFLQHDEDTPRESEVLVTRDGKFTYVGADLAERGTYHAWAEVEAANEPLASDKVTIVAQSQGVAAAAESIASMLTVTLPYLLILVAAGAGIGFLYNRRKNVPQQ